MKTFILKLSSYLLIMSLLVLGINAAYISMNQVDDECINKFNHMPHNIKICNVGSSHGMYGFDYDEFANEYNCFNFALSSQMPSYDYRLLYHYQKYLAKDCVVFITVSYFTFFGTKEEQEERFAEKNKRYYKILPSSLIKQYDLKTDIFSAKFPALTAKENLFTVLSGKSKNTFGERWNMIADSIDVVTDAKDAYQRHVVTNKYNENGTHIYNDEEINAVYDIISLCKENGWRPILVTTPYLSEYTNEIKTGSPEFYTDFYEVVNQIKDKADVEYYDYAFDERFIYDYSLFMNSDHLNQTGAKKFVRILMEEAVSKR